MGKHLLSMEVSLTLGVRQCREETNLSQDLRQRQPGWETHHYLHTMAAHSSILPAVPNPIFQVINLTSHCKTLYNSTLLDIQLPSHLCNA